MANNITDINDYYGLINLPKSGQPNDFFENFAFDIEKEVLRGNGSNDYGLLGDDLYAKLIANLDATNEPTTEPYITLVNGGNYLGSDGKTIIFDGLKRMLTYFVYNSFVKENFDFATHFGTAKTQPENSERGTFRNVNYKANKRYNIGVESHNGQVYNYLQDNSVSFPTWVFTPKSKFLINGII